MILLFIHDRFGTQAGAESNLYHTATEPSFGERNLVVYAGRIVRGKGVDMLLRSLARVRNEEISEVAV